MTAPDPERLKAPGYTPKVREVAPLLALLEACDDDLAGHVERALSRVAAAAVPAAIGRFATAAPVARARFCSLVGRAAAASGDPELRSWLRERLRDADERTRRRAIRALGNLPGDDTEAALLAVLERTPAGAERRALTRALGSAGGARALAALSARPETPDDPELERLRREAVTKLERVHVRAEESAIDGGHAPLRRLPVLLHVRAGLEETLMEELGERSGARVVGRGRIEVALGAPLSSLFRARTFLHLGFPLPPEDAGASPEDAVVRALSSDAAWEVLGAFTHGPIRYRLEWASAGRRRAATLRVAARVAAVRPALVNDPRDAPWEVVVTERSGKTGGRVFVELWPRGLDDSRFSYRRRALPASSHPTLAAALARFAGVRPDDVVWDPFVGAGGELVERALLGPYRRLYGFDTDEGAIAAATENLTAAGLERWTVARGDARRDGPGEAPTLLVSNPPFGKRIKSDGSVPELLDAVLGNAARRLAPHGRVVWISPAADRTVRSAERREFTVERRQPVDVGGIPGEIQVFTRGTRASSGSG